MTVLRHHFTAQQAPCGKIVDADDYEDRDDDALVTLGIEYACGCVSIQHEYTTAASPVRSPITAAGS